METERINLLLKNPTEATADDVFLLEKEIHNYPYAQVLHILLAKVQFQINAEEKNKKLTRAAIYSSERSILKKVIQEKGFMDHNEEIIPFQDLLFSGANDSLSDKFDSNDDKEENESSSIFDEVLKNLERLKSLRKQFQFLELNEPDPPKQDKSKEIKKQARKTKKDSHAKSKNVEIESGETLIADPKQEKLKEILEKDEVLDSKVNVFFLKEIENNKTPKKQTKTEEHTTQYQIIEKFIEEQPSIGSAKREAQKSSDEINKDLSEKSTKFGDDLISENLAIILLKQGKKERSIDIYKKLIWKLPQKKAYFAARIEEIKN